MKIVFATGNPHKVEELKAIAASMGRDDIEFVLPPKDFNPVEDGETFEENSFIKAKEANRLTKMISLADDSGLCVEVLDNGPGIHSARYADSAQARIDKLLKAINTNKNRKAKFVCAMTLLDEKGHIIFQTRGECHGKIAKKQAGKNGFGYDPIFIVENTTKTMAELSEKDKNKISHRGNALRKVLHFLSTDN